MYHEKDDLAYVLMYCLFIKVVGEKRGFAKHFNIAFGNEFDKFNN